MSILVVGSVAFDSVKTPFGEKEKVLGGSATYFSVAASFFSDVRVVAVVGEDFGRDEEQVFIERAVDISDMERIDGQRSFHWKGAYGYDLNTATTLDTQLNVFADFKPKLSSAARSCPYLFLGNIQPSLQCEVLDQVPIYGELHRYIPVLAARRGFLVGELAVRHHARRTGASKYGWDRFYKGLLDLLTVLFITKYTRRPLHSFGVFGLAALAVGFVINAWLAYLWAFRDEALSQRPLLILGVLLMLAGLQVLTTGLLAEMTTHKTFRRIDSYSVRDIVD